MRNQRENFGAACEMRGATTGSTDTLGRLRRHPPLACWPGRVAGFDLPPFSATPGLTVSWFERGLPFSVHREGESAAVSSAAFAAPYETSPGKPSGAPNRRSCVGMNVSAIHPVALLMRMSAGRAFDCGQYLSRVGRAVQAIGFGNRVVAAVGNTQVRDDHGSAARRRSKGDSRADAMVGSRDECHVSMQVEREWAHYVFRLRTSPSPLAVFSESVSGSP